MTVEIQFIKAHSAFLNYCYLLYNRESKEGILIDSSGHLEDIQKFVSRNGINLTKIVLTQYSFFVIFLKLNKL